MMGTVILLMNTGSIAAQDVQQTLLAGDGVSAVPSALHEAPIAGERHDSLTLSLPTLTSLRTLPAYYGYWGSPLTGFSDWRLHQGLNVSLSASAIWGLGHPGGSGFANSLSLMYAGSVTPKLSFAIGGYTSFLDYGGRQMRDAGLSALLAYQIDEHWEASAFIKKSFAQPRLSPQLYWLSDVGDKIGASVQYHFNPSFSIGVSVWSQSEPRPIYHY